MPAYSEKQRKAAGLALSAKRGETPVSELKGAAKDMYDSMSEKELEDFASGVREGIKVISKGVHRILYTIVKENNEEKYFVYYKNVKKGIEKLQEYKKTNNGKKKLIKEYKDFSKVPGKYYSIIEHFHNKYYRTNWLKEHLNENIENVKPFDDVKIGETAIDYKGNEYEIIDLFQGPLGDSDLENFLKEYDTTGHLRDQINMKINQPGDYIELVAYEDKETGEEHADFYGFDYVFVPRDNERNYDEMSKSELNDLVNKAIDAEDYEQLKQIRPHLKIMNKIVNENINKYLYGPSEEEIDKRLEKDPQFEHPEDIFMDAAKYGFLKAIKKSIEQIRDVDVYINDGLIYASENGHLNVVKYLVENGANVNIRDNLPLQSAAEFGHLDVVKYLVEQGANIYARNGEAFKVAYKNGHTDIVNYLEKKRDEHENS